MAEDRDPGQVWGEFEGRCESFRTELRDAREEFAGLEARRDDAREGLRRAAISFGYGVHVTGSVLLQNHLIRQIYWLDKDIPTDWIAMAFGLSEYEVVHIAGRPEPELNCVKCGRPVAVDSREELRRLQREQRKLDGGEGRGLLAPLACRSCWKTVTDELDTARAVSRKAHAAQVKDLRSLSYADYINTPEWLLRRKRHLEEVDSRCQVCGSAGGEEVLSVRHRSRKRLGEEPWDDLIALCHGCDVLFQERSRAERR